MKRRNEITATAFIPSGLSRLKWREVEGRVGGGAFVGANLQIRPRVNLKVHPYIFVIVW